MKFTINISGLLWRVKIKLQLQPPTVLFEVFTSTTKCLCITNANNELMFDLRKDQINKYTIKWLNRPKDTLEGMLTAEIEEGGLDITDIAE